MLTVKHLFSQNKQLLFGFNDIPQSVLINPSTTLDNDWFVGVPLLSHFHFNFGSSGISTFDLFADDGRDFNDKLQSVIFQLDRSDFFTATQQLDIFSGGFAFGRGIEKDRYLSFGMYLETDVIAYHPKDYAILAYEGNATNIGRVFDVSDFNLSGEMVSVFHVGLTKKVNDKFTIGARGKIYSSVFNINSTNNRGSFLTQEGQNNLLIHTFNLDFTYNTSGIRSLAEDDNSEVSDDIRTLRRRLLFGGNLGLGLDFGFTYFPTDQWTIEASLLDVGFIRHSKDLDNYAVNGSYVYEGINPLFPEVPNGQTAEDYWNEVADNFEELFEIDTTATKYTTWRPTKFNAAVRYSFGERISKDCNCLAEDSGYLNAVGAQLFAVRRPRAPQLALTAFYYRRLFEGLQFKATYTIDSFSFTNVGLGISADLGPLNLYVLADNVLEYQNLARSQSNSIQFGLNLVFGSGQ
ncbi:DUF5723 family protein [Winogradskyella sp.]|uniref:DUF5723 family protein n=1 Tax=Winogradskyella sp. TaxID=1883156 RepID=UPI0026349874|nr:DUF5723 family protein [Winogradskyella sp.]